MMSIFREDSHLISSSCDECHTILDRYTWKALMKDFRVLCKSCYEKEKKEAEEE